MSVAKFSVGRSGAGGANAEYITREKAAEKIAFFNLEKLEAKNKEEARTNAIAYAHTREESELAKNKKGRTHYRLILSWDGKETSENATEEAEKFLAKNLPEARAIIAIHQDTDNTHAHIWIDARQTDNKKIHLPKNKFQSFDERWAEQFDETYGTVYAAEYKVKKAETKQWKQTRRKWKDIYPLLGDTAEYYPLPAKPPRAADTFDSQYWREKEIENLGGVNKTNEKIGLGTNQSTAQTGNRPFERTERSVVGTEPEFQNSDSITTGKSKASRSGNDFVLPESRTNIGEGQGNTTDFDKNQFEYIHGSILHDVYDPFPERPAAEFNRQENTEEQFYESRFREYSDNGREVTGNAAETYSGITDYAATNIELLKPLQISITEPQIVPNNEAFIKDIMDMMRQNLEDQDKQMSLRAWKIYEERLNIAATIPPPQAHINYVNKFNETQESEDKKIKLEDKSKLEVIHDIASRADNNDRQKMFNQTTKDREQKVVQEKIEARQQAMELDRGMSM